MLGLSALTLGVGCEAPPRVHPGSAEAPRAARPSEKMPVVFVGHGSPMLALDAEKGAEFTHWGAQLVGARGILMVSAHWAHAGSTLQLGPLERSPLIYDFYGFPRELYQVTYDPPGGAPLAAEVTEALAKVRRADGVRQTARGLDHGSWTPLVHLFPKAELPVLQLSLPLDWGGAGWFELGEALAPLRAQGIIVMGSGNVTHNLRRFDPRPGAPVPSWASDFDDWAKGALSHQLGELPRFAERAPALAMNHPTLEHLAPLIVAAGAASASGATRVRFPIEGWEAGSFSRRSVEFT